MAILFDGNYDVIYSEVRHVSLQCLMYDICTSSLQMFFKFQRRLVEALQRSVQMRVYVITLNMLLVRENNPIFDCAIYLPMPEADQILENTLPTNIQMHEMSSTHTIRIQITNSQIFFFDRTKMGIC